MVKNIIEKLKLKGPGKDKSGIADRADAVRIDSLTSDELQSLNASPAAFVELFRLYRQSGCSHTSRSFLRLFLGDIYFDCPEIDDLLNEELFGLEDRGLLADNIRRVRDLVRGKTGRPRITLFSLVWVRGGMERVLTLVSEYLSEKYDVVIISDFNEGQGYPIPAHVTGINFCARGTYASRLADLVGISGTDVFVGNPNHIIEFLPVYEMIREQGIKTIASNHMNYFLPLLLKWLYPVWKKRKDVYRMVDCVVWPVRVSTFLHRNAIAENAVCIPNPLTFIPVSPDERKPQSKTILVVGRFDDTVKRFDRLLAVFKRITELNPQCMLTVVGRFDENWHIPNENPDSLGDIIRKRNIPRDRISFVGETDAIEQYYRDACALLMTSESECFPMVLLEARAHGVPPVVFDFPGVEDIVTDGVNGVVVSQGDVEGMALHVNRILTDDRYFRKLSENARTDMEQFSIDVVGKKWDDLIQDVLKGTDGGRIIRDSAEGNMNDADVQKFCATGIGGYEDSVSRFLEVLRDCHTAESAMKFSLKDTIVYRGLRSIKRKLLGARRKR